VRKVLVLGGDEYIGGSVLRALKDSNWAAPIADPVKDFEPRAFAAALAGVDAVVNCHSGAPQQIEAAATALFATAPLCPTPPLIVHLSSMSVYGAATGAVKEDAPLEEDLAPYAQAKVRAEKLAAVYPRKVVLRPGVEYGPGCELWSGRIAKWLFSRRVGDLGANGDGYCNLVHIDDLVSAVLLSLQQPAAVGKIFNLAAPNPPTWNEYLIRYALALGATPVKRITRRALALETKLLAIPLKVFEIAARKARLPALLPPPIPPSFLSLTQQAIRLDSTCAREVLGWKCRPLMEGLSETARWFTRTYTPRVRSQAS
jgi:2-alkyl-3-oxoalkanoate reductase